MIQILLLCILLLFFFFNDTATTEIYTLSLHDALPILRTSRCTWRSPRPLPRRCGTPLPRIRSVAPGWVPGRTSTVSSLRSEEHTSELQSRRDLVCRLLLEKKKKNKKHNHTSEYFATVR